MAVKKPIGRPRGNIPAPVWPDYGIQGDRSSYLHVLDLELQMFSLPYGSQVPKMLGSDGQWYAMDSKEPAALAGRRRQTNPKGKPRWFHAKNAIDIIWNYPGSPKPFVWHPDALRMLKAACRYKRLGVPGAGSTGKSDFFAVWAIINWQANPGPSVNKQGVRRDGTMVLVTSTTKSAAANRIWGKIVSYWNGMIAATCGKLLASEYLICYHDLRTNETDRTCGIKLVAGEASKAAKSADEIRGIKGDPVILIADEMPELSHSLTNTFDENLSANYNHQIIALGNPDTYFDPFGEFCEPVNGWESVGLDDYEWDAKKGCHVIRLNAEESPNITEGKVLYPFLLRQDQLEERQRNLGGRHTPAYYRGVLGMWCPTGHELTIYTQAELLQSNAFHKVGPGHKDVWRDEVTYVAGFDVAFTHEGDRSVLVIGRVGYTVAGKLTLEIVKIIEINEDTRIKDVDRTTQIVRKLKEACIENHVLPENLAIDATGPGGKAFRDAVISQWSSKFLAVDFAGAPSDRQVSKTDKAKCKDRYDRRVSEVWFSAKSFLRGDQLRGVTNELAAELVVRRYKETKPGSEDRKISVETKLAMKHRTQKSPDVGDGAMILCELCRVRHKFVSDDPIAESKSEKGRRDSPTKRKFRQLQGIYEAA